MSPFYHAILSAELYTLFVFLYFWMSSSACYNKQSRLSRCFAVIELCRYFFKFVSYNGESVAPFLWHIYQGYLILYPHDGVTKEIVVDYFLWFFYLLLFNLSVMSFVFFFIFFVNYLREIIVKGHWFFFVHVAWMQTLNWLHYTYVVITPDLALPYCVLFFIILSCWYGGRNPMLHYILMLFFFLFVYLCLVSFWFYFPLWAGFYFGYLGYYPGEENYWDDYEE